MYSSFPIQYYGHLSCDANKHKITWYWYYASALAHGHTCILFPILPQLNALRMFTFSDVSFFLLLNLNLELFFYFRKCFFFSALVRKLSRVLYTSANWKPPVAKCINYSWKSEQFQINSARELCMYNCTWMSLCRVSMVSTAQQLHTIYINHWLHLTAGIYI